MITDRFVDEFAQQQDVINRVCASGVLDGVHLYVYGFDMLQPQMCDLLCSGMAVAGSITITMVMDEKTADDGHVFLAQRHTAEELIHRLQERQLPYRQTRIDSACVSQPAAIRTLERGLFSRKRVTVSLTEEDQQCVQVYEAADPYA